MITTLLGGPLDGQQLNLSGFTRAMFSARELLRGGTSELYDAAPPTLVVNDDGNFVAVWPDGHRIWPQGLFGFRHYYQAVEGYGYRFEKTGPPIA